MKLQRWGGSIVIGMLVSELLGQRYLVSALVCLLWNFLIDAFEKTSRQAGER